MSKAAGTHIDVRAPEELNRQLSRAQDAIRRRAFGMSASVALRSGFDEEGGGDWQESLIFGKLDGQWKLYVQAGFIDRADFTTRDLFSASLDTRLLAAKKIPVLVQALEASQAGQPDLAATTRELARFIDRMLRTDS